MARHACPWFVRHVTNATSRHECTVCACVRVHAYVPQVKAQVQINLRHTCIPRAGVRFDFNRTGAQHGRGRGEAYSPRGQALRCIAMRCTCHMSHAGAGTMNPECFIDISTTAPPPARAVAPTAPARPPSSATSSRPTPLPGPTTAPRPPPAAKGAAPPAAVSAAALGPREGQEEVEREAAAEAERSRVRALVADVVRHSRERQRAREHARLQLAQSTASATAASIDDLAQAATAAAAHHPEPGALGRLRALQALMDGAAEGAAALRRRRGRPAAVPVEPFTDPRAAAVAALPAARLPTAEELQGCALPGDVDACHKQVH